MKILTSILAKTTTGAVIEMIILLLIAGLIAYFTAYVYYKSIYTKRIKILEEEKLSLEQRIQLLEQEINELKLKVEELTKKG